MPGGAKKNAIVYTISTKFNDMPVMEMAGIIGWNAAEKKLVSADDFYLFRYTTDIEKAIAHIELNAIDLAWDMVARFTAEELPEEFYAEWVGVGDGEAVN